MTETISFFHEYDEWGELSNFASYPILVDGRLWPTSEHYYQAMKFDDPVLQERVRRAPSPRSAQLLARRLEPKRPGWLDRRLDVMREALRLKFSQHPHLADLLLSTGSARLVEASVRDDFFGVGADGTGHNHLGRLLEALREELRADRGG